MWKSSKPTFKPKRNQGNSEALCKTQYIGKVGSPQHQKALAAISRRKQLSHINKQISQLQEVV